MVNVFTVTLSNNNKVLVLSLRAKARQLPSNHFENISNPHIVLNVEKAPRARPVGEDVDAAWKFFSSKVWKNINHLLVSSFILFFVLRAILLLRGSGSVFEQWPEL